MKKNRKFAGAGGSATVLFWMGWVSLAMEGCVSHLAVPEARQESGDEVGKTPGEDRVWEVMAEFFTDENPSGAWSVGWTDKLGAGLTLFSRVDFAEIPPWAAAAAPADPAVPAAPAAPASASLLAPSAWKNVSADAKLGVPAGQLALHPGCKAGQYAGLRWTSPIAGSCRVSAGFLAGKAGKTDVHIIQGNVGARLDATTLKTDSHFGFETEVTNGETLDFAVGAGATPAETCASAYTSLVVSISCRRLPPPGHAPHEDRPAARPGPVVD